MTSRSVLRCLVLPLAAVLLVGACGSSSTPTESAAPVASEAVATPAPTATPSRAPTVPPVATASPAPTQSAAPAHPAGTYASTAFTPGVTYTVERGWEWPSDTATYFELRPAGSETTGIHLFRNARAARQDAACSQTPEPGVGDQASDLVAWIRKNPGFAAVVHGKASVGGLDGYLVDVALKDSWTRACPFAAGTPSVPLFVGGNEEYRWVVAGPERLLLYILDAPDGGTVVVDVDDFTGDAWDAFVAEARPVVDSMAFATPAPTPSPAPTAKPVTSGQTGKVSLPEYGFSVKLPAGWKTIGLTDAEISRLFEAVPKGTLPAGLADRAAALVAAGYQMWAFDLAPSGKGANMTVLAIGYRIPVSLLEATATAGIANVKGVSNVTTRQVEIDGETCLRVDLKLALTVAGTKLVIPETQLWIPRDHGTLVVTIGIPRGGHPADRDSLAKSIRLD